jgi:hypothetical protein
LRTHFRDNQIIDMALLSAYFLGGAGIITAFEPEIETPDLLQLELDWQRKRLQG